MPPQSSVEPVWKVEGFGKGKSSSGKNAPIHFGDVQPEHKAQEPKGRAVKKSDRKPATKSAKKGGR
jgi:hypothetical protein